MNSMTKQRREGEANGPRGQRPGRASRGGPSWTEFVRPAPQAVVAIAGADIPANTTATVFVPTKEAAGVTESGKPAAQAESVKFLRLESNAAVYAVGSGSYRFQSTLPETVKWKTKRESP